MRRIAVNIFAAVVSLSYSFAHGSEIPRVVNHPIPISAEQQTQPGFCYECHTDKTAKVVHGVMKKGNCTSCHKFSVSGDETQVTLIATGRELCLKCHEEKATEKLKGQIHKPNLGPCTTCHNPHASDNSFELIKGTTGGKATNLCLDCHEQGTKAFDGGSRHEILDKDKGCSSCHLTHKSGEGKKKEFDFHLTKASPTICLDCHKADNPKVKAAHSGQPFEPSDCTTCHESHASAVPKLIYATRHKPFAEKKCTDCHLEPSDGKVVLLDSGMKSCFRCHEEKKKQAELASWKHLRPVVNVTCSDCHQSHASAQPALMSGTEAYVCAKCHEKSTLPVKHGPYEYGKCTMCHDPHGSEQSKLLRIDVNTMCRSCHILGAAGVHVADDKVQLPWNYTLLPTEYENSPKLGLDAGGETGHPIIRHPFTGVNSKLPGKHPMTCVTCHKAHAAKTKHLLPDTVNDSIQLCEVCHK